MPRALCDVVWTLAGFVSESKGRVILVRLMDHFVVDWKECFSEPAIRSEILLKFLSGRTQRSSLIHRGHQVVVDAPPSRALVITGNDFDGFNAGVSGTGVSKCSVYNTSGNGTGILVAN